MNLDFTLIRKKADRYRSQGLHGEALGVYAQYIAGSAHIDQDTKSCIKKQIQLIESEMNDGDTEALKASLGQGSPDRKVFHRKFKVPSVLKGIAAFVLVGSIFFYFVDWMSDSNRDTSGEAAPRTATIIFKKMPAVVNNADSSTSPDNGMQGQRAMPPEASAGIRDGQSVVDSVETQAAVEHPPPPANDDRSAAPASGDDFQKGGTGHSETQTAENKDVTIAPGNPDPASVIDYVLKKRGRKP
jgi:hypothetical protein